MNPRTNERMNERTNERTNEWRLYHSPHSATDETTGYPNVASETDKVINRNEAVYRSIYLEQLEIKR